MANIFWRNGGAGALDGSSWDNAYADLVAAAAAVTDGDTLVMEANAGDTGNATTTVNFTGLSAGGSASIISATAQASGTAITYEKSTTVQFAADNGNQDDLILDKTNDSEIFYHGVFFSAADDLFFRGQAGPSFYYDSEFIFGSGTIGRVVLTDNGANIKWVSCSFYTPNPDANVNRALFQVDNRANGELINCTISNAPSSGVGNIVNFIGNSTLKLIGCDFSGCDFDRFFRVTNACFIDVFGCSIPNISDFLRIPLPESSQVSIYETDNVLSNRFYVSSSLLSFFQSETAIYLNNNLSVEAVTSANMRPWFVPAEFKMLEFTADFSTTKTIEIEFAQDGTTTALTDADIWFELSYPDDTTMAFLSESTKAAQPNSGLINYPPSLAGWSNLSGTNARQKATITTTQTGREGVAILKVYVAKPSTTVFIDPQITVT